MRERRREKRREREVGRTVREREGVKFEYVKKGIKNKINMVQ